MSALNQQETKVLREVQSLLNSIRLSGYDPDKDRPVKGTPYADLGKILKTAADQVGTIVAMKGYYPK